MAEMGVSRNLEMTYGDPVKLSKLDKQLLLILAQDGRMSIANLAKKTGAKRDTVKYRLDRLIKEHVIQGFVAVINPPKIGLPLYAFISLSFWNFSLEREKDLVAYIRQAPYIVYTSKTMGPWDISISVLARDAGHLDEVVMDLREKFSDIIKEVEITPIIKEYKWSECPSKLD